MTSPTGMPGPHTPPVTSPARERIVEAAAQVMRRLGLSRSTTKEIAREAGYSEAMLYKTFADKEELFLAVMHERFLPAFVGLIATLQQRVGLGSVEGTLSEVATAALRSYRETMPIGGALFGDPKLLARNREVLKARGAGPQMPNFWLGRYLAAEQRLGRISASVDPESAASLLIGACFNRAFLAGVMGDEVLTGSDEQYVAGIIAALLGGLAPTA